MFSMGVWNGNINSGFCLWNMWNFHELPPSIVTLEMACSPASPKRLWPKFNLGIKQSDLEWQLGKFLWPEWSSWGKPELFLIVFPSVPMIYLVGGLNPSEKYESIGMIIPNIWENKNMFQTTNQLSIGLPVSFVSRLDTPTHHWNMTWDPRDGFSGAEVGKKTHPSGLKKW